jgi:hypothetical protein
LFDIDPVDAVEMAVAQHSGIKEAMSVPDLNIYGDLLLPSHPPSLSLPLPLPQARATSQIFKQISRKLFKKS